MKITSKSCFDWFINPTLKSQQIRMSVMYMYCPNTKCSPGHYELAFFFHIYYALMITWLLFGFSMLRRMFTERVYSAQMRRAKQIQLKNIMNSLFFIMTQIHNISRRIKKESIYPIF